MLVRLATAVLSHRSFLQSFPAAASKFALACLHLRSLTILGRPRPKQGKNRRRNDLVLFLVPSPRLLLLPPVRKGIFDTAIAYLLVRAIVAGRGVGRHLGGKDYVGRAVCRSKVDRAKGSGDVEISEVANR